MFNIIEIFKALRPVLPNQGSMDPLGSLEIFIGAWYIFRNMFGSLIFVNFSTI